MCIRDRYMTLHNTTQKSAEFYKERQERLNSLYSDRVREWLKYFDLDTKYKDKVIHIITCLLYTSRCV